MCAICGLFRPDGGTLDPARVSAMRDATVRERFVEFGAEPLTSTPDELGRYIAAEVVKWRELITRAGIKLEQ